MQPPQPEAPVEVPAPWLLPDALVLRAVQAALRSLTVQARAKRIEADGTVPQLQQALEDGRPPGAYVDYRLPGEPRQP